MNKLREQIVKVLKTGKKKITRIWREMLKTVLAESEIIMRKVLSHILTAV